ncbi:MAG: MYXO-CTERM sorting domain-containing protein, partial [Myxococcales bacterium FL481]
KEDPGCGCSSQGGASWWWALALGVPLLRRRRS